jgi:protein-tyrosine phosphatase
VNFPIYDNQTPHNRQHFLAFLKDITSYIKNDKKIYIHCKGGHGRSGIVVASLLCLLYGMTPHKALIHCTNLHARRPNLKQKWKNASCPQLYRQQKYVHELFVHQKEVVMSDVMVHT